MTFAQHTPTQPRTCVRCVMDTSDPEINFDAQGVCNHCREFDAIQKPSWLSGQAAADRLAALVSTIKAGRRDSDYDCILGLSGGVDSSYLAIKAVELGLRPLVVHIDGGWNSEAAVQNIEKLVINLGLDLHTVVIDWEEMRDLQVAFLRAGVPNQDIPQDHAFFAALYRFAISHRVRWVLSGANIASESILPQAWGYNAMDGRHLRAINGLFGVRRLRAFPVVGLFDIYFRFPFWHRMRVARPLNYMPYDKEAAKHLLMRSYGWKDYGAKHHESVWTKFFQGYYLPVRFGFDKRKAHLSSLILAGQLTRDQALLELEKAYYPPDELRRDKTFILKKLSLSEPDFDALLKLPLRSHADYPNNAATLALLRRCARRAGLAASVRKIFKS